MIQVLSTRLCNFFEAVFRESVSHPEFNFSGRVKLTLPSKLNPAWKVPPRYPAVKKVAKSRSTIFIKKKEAPSFRAGFTFSRKIFGLVSSTLLLLLNVHAHVDWPNVIDGILQDPSSYHLTPIDGGASNINYHLELDNSHYFIRIAPTIREALYSDLAIEYKVLQLLSKFGISANPIYFNPEKKILVTDFIHQDNVEVDLLDPLTRCEVIALLHKVENSKAEISRIFYPYQSVMQLVEKAHSFSNNEFPPMFYELLLPLLKQIDSILSQNSKKSLCHLDLHHKNILRNKNRFWIVDWEYAVMSHPFLVLASMASIEGWNDDQMEALLNDYCDSPSKEDFYCLYLYRIVVDIFWTVWNHVQAHCSVIDAPYAFWEKLYYDAAIERIQSKFFIESMKVLNKVN